MASDKRGRELKERVVTWSVWCRNFGTRRETEQWIRAKTAVGALYRWWGLMSDEDRQAAEDKAIEDGQLNVSVNNQSRGRWEYRVTPHRFAEEVEAAPKSKRSERPDEEHFRELQRLLVDSSEAPATERPPRKTEQEILEAAEKARCAEQWGEERRLRVQTMIDDPTSPLELEGLRSSELAAVMVARRDCELDIRTLEPIDRVWVMSERPDVELNFDGLSEAEAQTVRRARGIDGGVTK